MNDKRFTLDELTIEVNKELKKKELVATDSRQSKEFSSRRIRGLAGENLISKPFKDGRNVYYTQLHVNELVDFKTLQSVGLSEKSLLSFKSETKEDSSEPSNDTLDGLIRSMRTRDNTSSTVDVDELTTNFMGSADAIGIKGKSLIQTLSTYSSVSYPEGPLPKNKENVKKMLKEMVESLPQEYSSDIEMNTIKNENVGNSIEIKSETWNEYKLSDNTILKVKANTELDDLHTLIEQLKKIDKQLKNK